MAWTTPITWASGLVTSAMMNAQVRDNLNALQAMVKPGTAIVGTAPASTTLMTVQAFSFVGTTTSAGGLNATYPTTFANGIQSITVTPGDNAGGLVSAVPILVNCTLSAANVICLNGSGAALNTQTVRVNVIAVGW